MILDQTKWKYSNNIMASLLAPYLFSSLPIVIFQVLRNGVGKWIALLTVILRLFFTKPFSWIARDPGCYNSSYCGYTEWHRGNIQRRPEIYGRWCVPSHELLPYQ